MNGRLHHEPYDVLQSQTLLPLPPSQATKLGSEQEQARQSLVRERHAAAATAELQRQLKTARERGEGLVSAGCAA